MPRQPGYTRAWALAARRIAVAVAARAPAGAARHRDLGLRRAAQAEREARLAQEIDVDFQAVDPADLPKDLPPVDALPDELRRRSRRAEAAGKSRQSWPRRRRTNRRRRPKKEPEVVVPPLPPMPEPPAPPPPPPPDRGHEKIVDQETEKDEPPPPTRTTWRSPTTRPRSRRGRATRRWRSAHPKPRR